MTEKLFYLNFAYFPNYHFGFILIKSVDLPFCIFIINYNWEEILKCSFRLSFRSIIVLFFIFLRFIV